MISDLDLLYSGLIAALLMTMLLSVMIGKPPYR
jgi:hypothetical protein